MLSNVLIAVAVIVVIFLIIVALRPSDFCVTRSSTITAPPGAVFPHVNEFKKWEAWNPWGKIDPAMKQTYEGPAAGVGCIYSWVGNNQVGEGRMTITESRPNEFIQLKLEFFKPMAGICTTVFTFKPEGNQTTVTWTMTGKHNFIARAMCLFMNMDKMIGGQFEKGLASMKAIAESSAK